MADLSHAGRVARGRARARASQQPSPVGVVGWRKPLRLLFARTPLAVGLAMQLPIAYGTEACMLRAVSYSLRSGSAQGRRSSCKKFAKCTARGGANPRWWCVGHVYDGGRASMRRLCVRALCL